ncbi:MAG: hypothetical protein K2J28_05995, partial [Duncaniella sp.]|nr:hypothetical protein [Duncaniella sp.]
RHSVCQTSHIPESGQRLSWFSDLIGSDVFSCGYVFNVKFSADSKSGAKLVTFPLTANKNLPGIAHNMKSIRYLCASSKSCLPLHGQSIKLKYQTL